MLEFKLGLEISAELFTITVILTYLHEPVVAVQATHLSATQ